MGTTPYPRAGPEGVPEPTGLRRWVRPVALALAIPAGLAVVVLTGLGLLYAFNPMGDEWVCSQGEAPAGSACYPLDQPLPAGLHWDPLGNRPMSYNCDKRGWTLIEHDRRDEQDCLNDDLPMPSGWHAAD